MDRKQVYHALEVNADHLRDAINQMEVVWEQYHAIIAKLETIETVYEEFKAIVEQEKVSNAENVV